MTTKESKSLPLSGVRVIEIAGLAPAPFCGMILADFGADVIRVDRTESFVTSDVLGRGKRSIAINFKSKEGVEALLRLLEKSDVLIDPFRPGVAEKLGFGPDAILKRCPKLIYARLTGFGQTGPFAKMAGHDINYIALSGALSLIGRKGENPMYPVNLLGDFAGGGMLCALGIAFALFERVKSGKGQIIDASMVDGAAYLSTFVYKLYSKGLWGERGTNMLDSGAPFYEVYKTKDDKYVSVGAIEPQFYSMLLKGLGIDPSTLPPQNDPEHWEETKKKFANIFLTKTREEWSSIFDGTDACVVPVLEMEEVAEHQQNRSRKLMMTDPTSKTVTDPSPAPRLSRTPAHGATVSKPDPQLGHNTVEVFTEFGFTSNEIRVLIQNGAIKDTRSAL